MTEFETATLAIQQGQFTLQQAQLALQESQLWAAIAIPVTAALVGVGQIWVVWRGIRAMVAASKDRTTADIRRAEAAETAATRRAEAETARHAETMRALEVLIERTGSRA